MHLVDLAAELEWAAQELRAAIPGFAGAGREREQSDETLRLQLARAGDVAIKLIEEKQLLPPTSQGPWLQFALKGDTLWEVEAFIAPSSEGGIDISVSSFEEFLSLASDMQGEHGHGDSLTIWQDAVARFVRRHLFLEMVVTWLPEAIGLIRPRLVLPQWFICTRTEFGIPSFELVSDWLECSESPTPFSTVQAVSAECARVCDALARWARTRAGCAQENPSQSPLELAAHSIAPGGTATDARSSLPPQVGRAYNAYLFARQLAPDEKSSLKLYELLVKAEHGRAMLPKVRDEIISAETFRRYVAEAERRLDGRKRGVAQRLREG